MPRNNKEEAAAQDAAFLQADNNMIASMDAWYDELDNPSFTDKAYYLAYKTGIKSGLGRTIYYPLLKKKLR